MQLSHTRPVAPEVFDDPNPVSGAGLVPMFSRPRNAAWSHRPTSTSLCR